MFQQRFYSSSQAHEKYPMILQWKHQLRRDTSDFIANDEIFFVCCNEYLEDTIQNNF